MALVNEKCEPPWLKKEDMVRYVYHIPQKELPLVEQYSGLLLASATH